jgi:type IV pilus assembly protein PilC
MQYSTFYWSGIDKNGKKISGETEAQNTLLIKMMLRKQGIQVQYARKKKNSIIKKTIPQIEITSFTRQIATLLKAGIPLIHAFETISKSTANSHFKNLLKAIKNDLETGTTFNQALNKYKNYFNDFYCHLIAVAEQTGELDLILEKLAHHQEKLAMIKQKLHKAFYYPIIVLFVSIIISVGLLIFIVPQFEDLFKTFGATMPFLTQCIISISQFCQRYGLLLLILSFITIIAVIYKFKQRQNFRLRFDFLLLKIPIIGQIVQKSAIARFSQTLAITLSAGVSLMEGLKSAAKVTGNLIYQTHVEKIVDEIAQGKPLHLAMQNTHLFPEMILQMVLVGEESGTLEHMLIKITDYYQEDVENAVDSLSTLLEPVLMIILSIFVGTVILGIYLPIFKLGAIAF